MDNKIKAFTTECKGIANVLMNQVILSPKKELHPNSKLVPCKAIWDTGATNCAISTGKARECNLTPTGKAITNTANGPRECLTYVVDLILPCEVVIPNVTVTECELDPKIDMLIGMDIMNLGNFSVSNFNGKTKFSFKIPSDTEIDYVKEMSKINKKKLLQQKKHLEEQIKQHGNEKCPCGSGRKYRYCCGKNEIKELTEKLEVIG